MHQFVLLVCLYMAQMRLKQKHTFLLDASIKFKINALLYQILQKISDPLHVVSCELS